MDLSSFLYNIEKHAASHGQPFDKQTIMGPATLKVVDTSSESTKTLISEYGQNQDSAAIMSCLHYMLSNFLTSLFHHSQVSAEHRPIFIPVVIPHYNYGLVSIQLRGGFRGWKPCLVIDNVENVKKDGVRVAQVFKL